MIPTVNRKKKVSFGENKTIYFIPKSPFIDDNKDKIKVYNPKRACKGMNVMFDENNYPIIGTFKPDPLPVLNTGKKFVFDLSKSTLLNKRKKMKKANASAIKIQRFWKKFQSKRSDSAIIIQEWWKFIKED